MKEFHKITQNRQIRLENCSHETAHVTFCESLSKFIGFYFTFQFTQRYEKLPKKVVPFINPNQFDVWEALSGWGGLREPPPLLSWLWSKFLLKNHVSPKAGINSNSFGPFSEYFFQKSQKNWRKLEIYQKIAKNEWKF